MQDTAYESLCTEATKRSRVTHRSIARLTDQVKTPVYLQIPPTSASATIYETPTVGFCWTTKSLEHLPADCRLLLSSTSNVEWWRIPRCPGRCFWIEIAHRRLCLDRAKPPLPKNDEEFATDDLIVGVCYLVGAITANQLQQGKKSYGFREIPWPRRSSMKLGKKGRTIAGRCSRISSPVKVTNPAFLVVPNEDMPQRIKQEKADATPSQPSAKIERAGNADNTSLNWTECCHALGRIATSHQTLADTHPQSDFR